MAKLQLKRKKDWRTRMNENLASAMQESFVWGQHDCVQHASKHIEAITGVDPAAELRGKYDSAFGALRAIKELGFDDLRALCNDLFEPIHISKAALGDLAIVESPEGYCLGIVEGEIVSVLRPEGRGFIRRSSAAIVEAYRI